MKNREKIAGDILLEETVTYTDNGEGLKGEWNISKLLETVENAKKEEDPLIGKYILTEKGTVGKVVYKHTEYQTGYTVYTGGERVYQFYTEEYVQENLIEGGTQTLISDKNIGEDIVDVLKGLTLGVISDMLQEFTQENDMEYSTTGTHEGVNYCYSVVREQMDAKDELIGRHILFDDFTIGRVVGTTQTATYNKAYKICDSLEPLNIQVRDEDFVKGGLIDESLEKYMKDEHLGRDFTGVMFQELSNVVRKQMGIEFPTTETQEGEGNYYYYQPEDVETPDSVREYIRNKAYEVFYENKIVVSENKVARICAYLQTPEGEEFFKVKTNLGECSWESKDWVDTHIAD